MAEIERRLGIAERLAGCIADPRAPELVRHSLAEMIRFHALLIAAGYPDANDCGALRDDPGRDGGGPFARDGGRCFLPMHIYEAVTGKPVAIILRPGKTPDGAAVALVLRHLVEAIRRRPARSS